MIKEDIDSRVLDWVSYIIENKIYKSEAKYLQKLGIPSNKLSDVRKGKTGFTTSDIGKILMDSENLNANWVMTGRGDMLYSEDSAYTAGQIDLLIKQNVEMKKEVNELYMKIGELTNQISSLKKGNARLGMVADNADADSYGLVK